MPRHFKHLYQFGPFRLDAAERRLSRDGEAIPLTPKAFDLLLALVEQPGRLLEREALLKAVWPDSFVEDNNLADNISRLRKALGDGDNGQKFIETIPKRGYRFTAEVRKETAGEETGPLSVIEEIPPAAPREEAPGGWAKPSATILSLFAFLFPVLVAAGLWVDFRLKKTAEVDRLEFQGGFFVSKWTEDDVKKGIEYYNRAIALDPESASAYAGLSAGWNLLSDSHSSPREAMPKAKAAAVKAIQLDETFAQAHVCWP